MHRLTFSFAILLVCGWLATATLAQPRRGRGFRGGHQHGSDERHQMDHDVFQFLLTNHQKIRRTVKELPSGVDTLTESDDPAIAAKIKEHVKWMKYRVEEVNPIRMRDPLFVEIFRHADKIDLKYEQTQKGVRVVETSQDPYVVKLIQRHAEVVSGFVERGFTEARKNHAVPTVNQQSSSFEYTHPAIEGYGQVVQLPSAAQQPRQGAKLLVDLTSGGQPDELNPGIDKVARFVNIYAGAGQKPAKATIAVVLHGDATLAALNDDAYAKRFGTENNPNLDCLHALHEAGVEIYVCGQSLIGKEEKPTNVAVFVDVAVSALTSMVNLQADGFAYVPMGK